MAGADSQVPLLAEAQAERQPEQRQQEGADMAGSSLHTIWPRLAALCILGTLVGFPVLAARLMPEGAAAATAAPIYARTAVAVNGVLSLMTVIPHLVLDDAGLECIAHIPMGKPSPPRTVGIVMCKMEGVERGGAALICLFVACRLPQYAFQLLLLQAAKLALQAGLNAKWPMAFDGQSLLKEAPGRFLGLIRMVITLPPLAYGCIAGDLWRSSWA